MNKLTKSEFDYIGYNEDKYENDFWVVNRGNLWFSNYVKLAILRKWVKTIKSKVVLVDVGGGVGNWSSRFLKDFDKVVVIDVSQKSLDKIPEKEIIKKQGSALDIPMKNESADCVFLVDVFEHIKPEDLPLMMEELNRILKKDGKVLIYTSQWGYGIRLSINKLFGSVHGRLMEHEMKEGHLNRLKYSEMKDLFKKSGFVIEDKYHYGIFFQQTTDWVKDSIARTADKLRGKKHVRAGQHLKEELKSKKYNPILKATLSLANFLSYLDILLFGKFWRGDTIFVLLRKNGRG